MVNDNTLVSAKAGDKEAVDALFRHYHNGMRRYAYTLIRNESDADDLTSVAWMRVLSALPAFRGSFKQLRPWLYTIVANLYKDRLTSLYRHDILPLDDLPIGAQVAWAMTLPNSVETDYIHREEREERMTILSYLPKMYRETLGLMLLGLSYEEMAQKLGIPIGTVKSRINRARVLLAPWLAEINA